MKYGLESFLMKCFNRCRNLIKNSVLVLEAIPKMGFVSEVPTAPYTVKFGNFTGFMT